MAAGVEQLLADMRKQFDDVHMEVLKQTADFTRFKEGIRQADSAEQLKEQDMTRLSCLQDMQRRIEETNATRKVYRHILDRTKRERASPSADSEDAREVKGLPGRTEREATFSRSLENVSCVLIHLRKCTQKDSFDRLSHKLCQWQQSVIKDAAAAAFSASSGRWRRMYGMEKLIANALQKITVEEVEKSQNTEDTFQKIREATGLDDVMDIVQKFLNKDVEHGQLQQLAAAAEARFEQTRAKYTEVLQQAAEETLSGDCGHRRHFYAAAEAQDETLQRAVKQHIASLDALTETTTQLDHAKQWAGRINALFVAAGLEEPFVCESVEGLVSYIAAVRKNTIPKLLETMEAQGELQSHAGDAINEPPATQGPMPAFERSRLVLKEVNSHLHFDRSSSVEDNSDEEIVDHDRLEGSPADHASGMVERQRSTSHTVQDSPALLKPITAEVGRSTLVGEVSQPDVTTAEGMSASPRDAELHGDDGPRLAYAA
uniref:Uncharacterized protein n=1 Tax=Toxoplasma gondii (strain ATCC 50861 / VEG) TaxID=432359 RepID=A0A0F7VAM2_TOXGV|nr:TPA: hypothetical protein BN1205_030500 [Toxoplasma gondii VEG]